LSEDTNKGAQQPLLQLVKDAFKPEPPNNKASQDSKSQLQPFAQVVKDTDKLQVVHALPP